MFYVRYLRLCKSVNKSASKVAEEAGINKGSVSVWKKKYERGELVLPNTENLIALSKYFGVSIDYLVCNSVENKKTAEPNKKVQQLIDIFDNFNDEGQNKLLEQAVMMQSYGAYNADSNVAKIAARSGNPNDVMFVDIDGLPDAPDTI